MKIREDRGEVIIIVFCGHSTVFTLPSQFCCSSKSDLVWYELFCFKGFWKKNKVVELCGLITTRELSSVKALCVLWGCSESSRTAFHLWFCSFMLSFRTNHHQLMLVPPHLKFICSVLLLLSYTHSFKIRKKKKSHGNKFPERLVFSLAFVTWLDMVLATLGTPENTGWLSLEWILETECFLSVGWGCEQDGLLWLSKTTIASE